jgi:hypothetical protein
MTVFEQRMWIRALLIGLLSASFGGPTQAQSISVKDVDEVYLRQLQLLGQVDVGSMTVFPVRFSDADSLIDHPWAAHFGREERVPSRWLSSVEAGSKLYGNTSFPTGGNDGAVWQGKGVTAEVTTGVTAEWRGLSLAIRPALIYTQNAAFELAPVDLPNQPPYAYPWRVIDMPQRFGPDSFWRLDLGQSELSVRGFGVSAGVSTSNLWWGPAQRNAILMGNNAAGFPHAFVGTDRAVSVGIGELEAQWIWGRLEQSDWFDPSLADKKRFLTGMVAAYSPSFLDGLTLGVARVFYAWVPEEGLPFGDIFLVFQDVRKDPRRTLENPEGDDEYDQLLSLFGRWAIPGAGFEAYAEWARNDHSRDFRDLVLQPGHAAGYTLGLQRVIDLSRQRILAVRLEMTDLERARHLRPTPTFYAHHIVKQGYTHRGEVIGAAIGPGGNSQHIGADMYAPWGLVGAYLERNVRDNDAFQVWAVTNNTTQKYWEHDVSLHLGLQAVLFPREGVRVGAGAVVSRELNRFFAGRDLWNLNVSLSAEWRRR